MRPGDIGEIIRLHGLLYPSEHGYSMEFEAYVARTLSRGAVRTEERYDLKPR
jgi:hypothetical protein